jgi:glycosyltransferase involved in cell wall biosynthesis
MELPHLSVIIPNYNHGRYIGRALESLLCQSVKPSEIIVIDDGSTDDSVAVISEFLGRSSIVRLLKNETNRGVEASISRGLTQASGDCLYWTSSDDHVLPGFVERSLAVLARYPQAGLVWSDNMTYEPATGMRNANRLCLSEPPRYFSRAELVELFRKNYIVCLSGFSSVMRRSAFLEPGVFVPSLKWYSDGFALTVIALRYGACYIPEVLTESHMSSKSYMRQGTRHRRNRQQVLRRLLEVSKAQEYQDVYAALRDSGALGWLEFPILMEVLRNPAHHDFLTVPFLRGVLRHGLKKSISGISPPCAKYFYHHLRDRYRKDVRGIFTAVTRDP